MSYIHKLTIAREFRNHPTSSEKKLWTYLKQDRLLGYRFRRQYVVAGFILDFYCPKLKLGVEVDGKIHVYSDNLEYDKQREKIISNYKINIIRFTNEQIDKDVVGVLNKIKDCITSSPK